MLVVGLTGGIGCGKSTVSNIFHQDFGVPIIDADVIARELSKTAQITELIYKKLGATYFNDKRILQRDKLRQAIFYDANIRYKLEKILHPLVHKEIDHKLKFLNAAYCIVVIPLLLETRRTNYIARILVVDCTVEAQIQRVIPRDQCNEAHVRAIIATQISREARLKLADDVIENQAGKASLKEKIAVLHEKYRVMSQHQPLRQP